MLRRAWSGLVGPLGAARSAGVVGAATAAGLVAGTETAARCGPGVGAFVGVTAVDLVGGMVAFQLRPTREHYARTSLSRRMALAAAHVQCFALPIVGEGTWSAAAGRWAGVVASTALLQCAVPAAHRRPAGFVLAAGLTAADVALAGPRQRWLGPVWFTKLVAGHATLPDPR